MKKPIFLKFKVASSSDKTGYVIIPASEIAAVEDDIFDMEKTTCIIATKQGFKYMIEGSTNEIYGKLFANDLT